MAVVLALLGASAGGAAAADGDRPGARVERFAPRQLVVKFSGEAHGRTVGLPRGAGVLATARALRAKPNVEYAQPNYAAHGLGGRTGTGRSRRSRHARSRADRHGPDPRRLGAEAVGLPRLHRHRDREAADLAGRDRRGRRLGEPRSGRAARRAGRRRRRPRQRHRLPRLGTEYLRSPDFSPEQFVPGDDFVDHDRLPLDENGHGTHVAGTIAEQTNNGVGLTGLAYGAKLMPVRVLNRGNVGYANRIAAGIRFAIAHHAQVINMSFNFGCGEKVPQVDEALREAYAHGIVTVASGGNLSAATSSVKSCVSEPATGPRVIGVGGTTEGGCIGSYSLAGKGIDVVAPGGGTPAAGCPSILSRPIYQVTLKPGTHQPVHDPQQLRSAPRWRPPTSPGRWP